MGLNLGRLIGRGKEGGGASAEAASFARIAHPTPGREGGQDAALGSAVVTLASMCGRDVRALDAMLAQQFGSGSDADPKKLEEKAAVRTGVLKRWGIDEPTQDPGTPQV